MKKVLFGVIATLFMSGCTLIDNFMLGEDNTPKPATLKPITNVRPMKSRWTQSVTTRRLKQTGYFKLAPVVKDGIVYTGAPDGTLEARDAIDGHLIWLKELNAAFASGPYVYGQSIALGGADASVFLVNRKDGQVKWHRQVSNAVLAPPVIYNGRVIAKTIDGHVYAFNEKSGARLWTYYHRTPHLILRASSTPEVVGNMVVVGFADGKLDGLSLDNGAVMWERSITYPKGSSDIERMVDIDATPIVKDGVVYAVSYQGYIVALSLSSGQFLWQHTLSSYRNMALGGRYLYVTDTHSDIWAFNIANGSVVWRQSLLHNRELTAPVITPLGLVFADKLGVVHLLSKGTGELIGRLNVTSDHINASPAYYNHQLYVQTARASLYDVEVG